MTLQILGALIINGVSREQMSEHNQVLQGIAGTIQLAQFSFFKDNNVFANNLTELQSANPNLTETGLVDEFVFDNTTYDYGGWEVTRVMINNTSSEARLYVVYTFEWNSGMLQPATGFAIFRTIDNQLTDTSIGYPTFSVSTGQTFGVPTGDHTYELVYSWPE